MNIFPKRNVDQDALRYNARLLRSIVGDFYCVVKCNAYGHGDLSCVKTLISEGFHRYAVANAAEACAVRSLSNDAEILVLGDTDISDIPILIKKGIIQTVFSPEYASALSCLSARPKLHMKLDSSMNRTGFKAPDISAISRLSKHITGIYTHFPRADFQDFSETLGAYRNFLTAAKDAEHMLGKRLTRHAPASASALRIPSDMLGDTLCRIGLSLYGYVPSEHVPNPNLKPVMTFVSRVCQVHVAKKGEYVGYGSEYLCESDRIIATVLGGYAHGLFRALSGKYCAKIAGTNVKLAGRPCMDRCMFDITDIIEQGYTVKAGDPVVFFDDTESALSFAKCAETGIYEVLTAK